jgi:hypothetical protein
LFSSFTIGIVDVLLDVGVGLDDIIVREEDVDIQVSEEEESEIHVSPLGDEGLVLVEV